MSIKKWVAIAWLFMCLQAAAQSENQPFDSATALMQKENFMQEEILDKDDPLPIALRSIPADTISNWSRDKKYAYMAYIDSLFRERAKEQPPSEKKQQKKNYSSSINWWRILLWTISFFALAFIIIRIGLGSSISFITNRRIKKKDLFETPDSSLQREHLAAAAILNKDYRLAVRYLFLDMLAALAAKGYIVPTPDKTNQQYLKEIADPAIRAAVAPLMLQYEYTWYGEFTPGEQQFANIHQSFKNFSQSWLQA